MRNIKELLQIVRDNIERLWIINGNDGICLVIEDLQFEEQIICKKEKKFLLDFIEKTKPDPFKNSYEKGGFGWEPGELQPRLEYLDYWLNKSLEELENVLIE